MMHTGYSRFNSAPAERMSWPCLHPAGGRSPCPEVTGVRSRVAAIEVLETVRQGKEHAWCTTYGEVSLCPGLMDCSVCGQRRGPGGLAPAHHPCRKWWQRAAPERWGDQGGLAGRPVPEYVRCRRW